MNGRPPTHASRRRGVAMLAIAFAIVSIPLLLNDSHVGPPWLQWIGPLVAIATGLAVVVAAELGWQRAVCDAESAGLVMTYSGGAS